MCINDKLNCIVSIKLKLIRRKHLKLFFTHRGRASKFNCYMHWYMHILYVYNKYKYILYKTKIVSNKKTMYVPHILS